MNKIKHLWKHNKLLLIAFIFAAIITIVFIVRTIIFSLYWADPAHRDQGIEPWMTIRYVSYSWDLPRDEMIQALGFEPNNGRLLTFGEIAAQHDVSLEEMTLQIKAAALEFRETHQ